MNTVSQDSPARRRHLSCSCRKKSMAITDFRNHTPAASLFSFEDANFLASDPTGMSRSESGASLGRSRACLVPARREHCCLRPGEMSAADREGTCRTRVVLSGPELGNKNAISKTSKWHRQGENCMSRAQPLGWQYLTYWIGASDRTISGSPSLSRRRCRAMSADLSASEWELITGTGEEY